MNFGFHALKFFCLALLASSCATTQKPGEPAVLSEMNAGIMDELTNVVSGAMNGAPTTLAPSVLRVRNSLYIARAPHRTIANNPAMGRRMDMPDHFTLSKSGNTCLLTHQQSGKTYKLKKAKCHVMDTQ